MINKKLDLLFTSWKKEMEKNGHEGFCYDGLIYRGGQEDELWASAPRKILFLLKEQNDNDGEDVREWSGSINGKSPYRNFYNRISAWLYGLTHATKAGYLSASEAFDAGNQMKALSSYPYAYVNLKKQTGGAQANDKEILAHAMIYQDFLREQLDILGANIVVCCGDVVFQSAKEVLYGDLEFKQVNDWIWLNKERNLILIHSFHPAALNKSNEGMYDWMMEKFIEVL